MVNLNHLLQLILELIILKFHVLVAGLIVVDGEVEEIHFLLEFLAGQWVVVLPELDWDLVGRQILLEKFVLFVVGPQDVFQVVSVFALGRLLRVVLPFGLCRLERFL